MGKDEIVNVYGLESSSMIEKRSIGDRRSYNDNRVLSSSKEIETLRKSEQVVKVSHDNSKRTGTGFLGSALVAKKMKIEMSDVRTASQVAK